MCNSTKVITPIKYGQIICVSKKEIINAEKMGINIIEESIKVYLEKDKNLKREDIIVIKTD